MSSSLASFHSSLGNAVGRLTAPVLYLKESDMSWKSSTWDSAFACIQSLFLSILALDLEQRQVGLDQKAGPIGI